MSKNKTEQNRTARKQKYFEKRTVGSHKYSRSDTQLSAKDLPGIFKFYNDKNELRFIKNGDFSPHVIKVNQDVISESLKDLTNERLRYAYFLKKAWITKGESTSNFAIRGRSYPELYSEIQTHLKQYLDGNKFRQDLSEEEILRLNEECQSKLSVSAKKDLDMILEGAISSLEEKLEDVCLTKEQAIEEIIRIQGKMEENDYATYVYTNNHREGKAHFETIIITKSMIIKPVHWDGVFMPQRLVATDFNGIEFYSADLTPFWDGPTGYMPEQQADISHCGVLGLLAAKKLLRYGAKELEEKSLTLSVYDKQGQLQQVFIPSPLILQYSQSSKFNEYLADIVSNKLFEALEHSIQHAESINDTTTADNNKKILKILPGFSKAWLNEYQTAYLKRNQMASSQVHYNIYLDYAARRMHDEIEAQNAKGIDTLTPSPVEPQPKDESKKADISEKPSEVQFVRGNETEKQKMTRFPQKSSEAPGKDSISQKDTVNDWRRGAMRIKKDAGKTTRKDDEVLTKDSAAGVEKPAKVLDKAIQGQRDLRYGAFKINKNAFFQREISKTTNAEQQKNNDPDKKDIEQQTNPIPPNKGL